MPPSPKNSAWIRRTMLTDSEAIHGSIRIEMAAVPIAWPLVPPGIGMLSIIITKERAERAEISGKVLSESLDVSFLKLNMRRGVNTIYPETKVAGDT